MVSAPLTPEQLVFFLGGYDLEMITIRDLLAQEAPDRFYDHALLWGANASAYQDELRATLSDGWIPVLVELPDDIGLDPDTIIVVDHHGERAGKDRPTALHQVFDLLALPPERWTRWFDLVVANDSGYIPAMAALGASTEEMVRVRAADRAAQGITPEEDAQGQRAVDQATSMAEGRLTVVRLEHAHTATVTDRLHTELGGPGYENLLVISPDEVNVFGPGELVAALDAAFPGGWYGGSLPDRGYWGHGAPVPEVLPVLLRHLERSTPTPSVKTRASNRDRRLFDQLTAFSTLERAFDRVEENQGGPGVDGETIEDFSANLERNLSSLQQSVRQGAYRPHALLRIYVEKDDGSPRPLSIPAVRDRVLQTAAALVLTPILDPEFEDVSYAYRTGRSVDQALQRIMALRDQGYRWVVDADIQRYFDEVPHDRLVQCLQQYVDDELVLSLVRQWLAMEVEDNTERFRLVEGVPQGSPLSPLLANLYLDRFDEALLDQGYKLVRFADDFVILCKTRPKAEAALELSETVLQELELTLHPDKTRITHFDHGFRYLGTQFLRTMAFRPKYGDELPEHLKPIPPVSPSKRPEILAVPPPPVAERAFTLKLHETTLSGAFEQALAELSPDDAKQLWEELCEGAEESDFPLPEAEPDPSLRSFYLMEQGSVLGKEDERFVVRKEGAVLRKIPALKVDQILVFGNVQITTPAMQFCLREDIPIFLLSSRGRFYGVVESFATDKVLLHRDQFARVADPAFILQVARQLVRGKIANCRTLLLRASRRLSVKESARAAAEDLQTLVERLEGAESVEVLRGLEGAAAARYFAIWPQLVGEAWGFSGRKRRPPPDPVNSLLSFGYTLLFYNTYALVRAQGLHPHVGFYHALRPGHPALISDLMEEFRAPLVDATVLALIHRNQVTPDDFHRPDSSAGPCLMTDAARKTATAAFENAFNRSVTHPDAGERCDYRRAIALQAQRLVAVIQDGIPDYQPFVRR